MSTVSVVLSVIRIALNLGSGRQDYVQVDVVSEGRTLEHARLEGFRTAVNYAVGSVVATQTETQQQRLIRDEVVNYSSGFVDRFEVLDQQPSGAGIRLKMRVWVAESRLARRLLGRSYDSQDVPGDQIQAQVQTIIDERKQGDRLVATVMYDFPQRAFDVEVKRIQVSVDVYRRAVLKIPVEVKWNRNFVNAVNEALERTNNDPIKHAYVYQTAVTTNPVIQLTAVDAGGQVLGKMCREFTLSPSNVGYHVPTQYLLMPVRDRVFFNTRYSLEGTLDMALPVKTEQINQIRATIVSQSKC
jgi:hypothetical protein